MTPGRTTGATLPLLAADAEWPSLNGCDNKGCSSPTRASDNCIHTGVEMETEADVLARLSDTIPTGGAVCLLGAGFSTLAFDANGLPVPGVQQLISEIKSAIGIDEEEDASLSDIADFCERDTTLEQKLVRILLNRLTLCTPSDEQVRIVNQPWRSIFTTNFDDTVEQCRDQNDTQPISPTSVGAARILGKKQVYYLHGRARDIGETSAEPRIVISESNYLKLHETNRDLYAQLKNELFAAKLIVIVGYSIRDLEIARIVLESGHAFKSKTVIICGSAEKTLAVSRLQKFGTVLPIGVAGLAQALKEAPLKAPEDKAPIFIEETRVGEPDTHIDGDDFIKLILTGHFSRPKYLLQLQGLAPAPEPYTVRRSKQIELITHRPAAGLNRFIISSDFGNGKTVFFEQLATELAVSGHRVYRVASRINDVFEEIESVMSTGEPVAFLIDDVIRYRPVAKFIAARLNSMGVLVCSMRGEPGEIEYDQLSKELGGAVRHIDLNRLSQDEIASWDTALERWGFWEQRISLSREDRISFLENQCASENRSIVLALFQNSQIAAKIDQIVEFFLRQGRHQKAFAALLVSSLCQQHVSWESLVSWLDIDEHQLRIDIRSSDLENLFFNGREWNIFTSSQLAEHILRTKYVESDKDTLLEVYTTVVLGTADSASDEALGGIYWENLKELMKFRFLTRLFGDGDASVQLIGRVYKRLSQARLIRNNPQFWLQYAMSKMEVDDLQNAEAFLETALGLAASKGKDYSPYQILDQRSRLYFRKSSASEGKFSPSEIRQAVKDLNSLLKESNREVIYLYRSVPLIANFLDMQIDHCSADIRQAIQKLLEEIELVGKGHAKLPRAQKGETRVLNRALDEALRTLRFA